MASLISPAQAADPAGSGSSAVGPSSAEKDTARTLAHDGDGLYAAGKYEAALARYSAAYHLVRVPSLGLQVAKTQVALGRLLDALATVREVDAMPARSGEPAVFATARKSAAELEAQLEARVPRLLVVVAPAGVAARISIDGADAPSASAEPGVELNPGLHELVVGAEGYSDVELEIELAERARERLPVTLFGGKLVSGAAPRMTPKGSGDSGATTAAGVARSQPGSAGASPDELRAPTETVDTRRDASDSARSARTRGYVALTLAGLSVAAGGVTGALAFSTKPDCPSDVCDPTQADAIDSSKLYGNIATVSFAVGGVCLVYALFELIANGTDPETAYRDSEHMRAALLPRDDGGVEFQFSSSF